MVISYADYFLTGFHSRLLLFSAAAIATHLGFYTVAAGRGGVMGVNLPPGTGREGALRQERNNVVLLQCQIKSRLML